MKKHLRVMVAGCSVVALVAAASISTSAPARAQFGIFIPRIGNIGIYGGGGCRHCGGGGGRHSGGTADDSDNDHSPGARSDRTTTLTPPSSKVENALLHVVAQLNPEELGSVSAGDATNKAVSPLGKAISKEGERDWTEAVQKIIKRFNDNQDKRVTTAGDVTEHAIEQSLDSAIKSSKLDTFESFLGENWTVERLRAMVLDLVAADLDGLFKGNSRGYARMQEVDDLIQHAAQATYRRTFEVSELLAANRSSALFVQRLYQTHGGRASEELREDAGDMLARTANSALSKFETALRQNENGYALRYRAERIIFDCLSENVEKISSSETDMAEKGEIAQRIDENGRGECATWVENQFGSDTRTLKPQKPVPLRVVWSPIGPKDDPSMYGRATNELQ
jgi:hypothetical protein